MAGKSINVKVSRVKIIDALQSRLAVMISEQEAYDKAVKQYEKDKADWIFNVSKLALSSDKVTLNHDRSSVNVSNWRTKDSQHVLVEVVLDFPKEMLPPEPKEPENPFKSYGYGRNYTGNFEERKEEIRNAVHILNLSDEEVVSTSTYQSVSRYL